MRTMRCFPVFLMLLSNYAVSDSKYDYPIDNEKSDIYNDGKKYG